MGFVFYFLYWRATKLLTVCAPLVIFVYLLKKYNYNFVIEYCQSMLMYESIAGCNSLDWGQGVGCAYRG